MLICKEQYISTGIFNEDRIEIIKLLLNNGAKTSSKSEDGKTAINFAHNGKGNSDIADFFKTYVINPKSPIQPVQPVPIAPSHQVQPSIVTEPTPESSPINVPNIQSPDHITRIMKIEEAIKEAELEIKLLTLQERHAEILVHISGLKLQAVKGDILIATETATLAALIPVTTTTC